MSVSAVDAPAIGALLFGEPRAEEMAVRLAGAPLAAPALMPFEVANMALVKMRREPAKRSALRVAFGLLDDMAIDIVAVDQRGILALAEETGLTFYDASYLWLARTLDAELVTRDRAALLAKWQARYPKLSAQAEKAWMRRAASQSATAAPLAARTNLLDLTHVSCKGFGPVVLDRSQELGIGW